MFKKYQNLRELYAFYKEIPTFAMPHTMKK